MFIESKKNIKIEDCIFYHSFKMPDGQIIHGNWDLTECVEEYLGKIDYSKKRIIDIGAASGYLSFYMEQKGADVTSFDMPDGSYWDTLKYPGYKPSRHTKRNEGLYNSYYYMHEKFNSKCKLYRANIYDDLPESIGSFDGAVFGTMLSHVRDPMLVLMNILYKVNEFAVLINPFPDKKNGSTFCPGEKHFTRTWWSISYSTIERMVNSIGWYIDKTYDIYPVHNLKKGGPSKIKYRSVVIKRYSS